MGGTLSREVPHRMCELRQLNPQSSLTISIVANLRLKYSLLALTWYHSLVSVIHHQ